MHSISTSLHASKLNLHSTGATAEHDYLHMADELLQALGGWLMWLPPSDAADHLTAIYHGMIDDIRDFEEARA
jgi:hypothetical protein